MSQETLGIQGLTDDDRSFAGSRFAEVRDAIFANPYQKVWGAAGEPAFPRAEATLGSVARGLLSFKPWRLLAAARRELASEADLRWGTDGKGYNRLLHPNGICLTGLWEITEDTSYTGYFQKGSHGLIVARYSTCCTETRRGYTRSLSMVGRIYPTTDRTSRQPLPTAGFISQVDIGGDESRSINDAILRNAPDTTISRRGWGAPILLLSGLAFKIAETEPTIRQLYQIAELGKTAGVPTRSPDFMQLSVVPEQPVIPGDDIDFRDEIMAQIYDHGDSSPKRKLVFRIETTDTGTTGGLPVRERRTFSNWKQIGKITFDEAVASYNGDHVLHFHHPRWRKDRNDPSTERGAKRA
jgi:hypothetical protein